MKRLLIAALAFIAISAALATGCRQERFFVLRQSACSFIAAVPLMPAVVVAEAHANKGVGDLMFPQFDFVRNGIRELEAAVQFAPRIARHHNNLANAYRAVGRLADALEHYSAAIDIDPSFGRAVFNRAMMQFALGRLGPALADSDRAVAMQPLAAAPMTVRGNLKLMLRRPTEANADHYEAVRLTPDFTSAYQNRACSNLVLGRTALAAVDRTLAACAIAHPPKPNERPSCAPSGEFMRQLVKARLDALQGHMSLQRSDFQTLSCHGRQTSMALTGALVEQIR